MSTYVDPTTITAIPRVWVGCLHCYNAGRLIGAWYNCTDLSDAPEDHGLHRIHRDGDYLATPGCEELWCFDHEWLPVKGELDPLEAARWGDLYNELGSSSLWPALCTWVEEGMHVTDADGMPITSEFIDKFQGLWESWGDYVYNLVEDTGLQQGWDDTAVRHFNWTSYAEEIGQDYFAVHAADHSPDCGSVYVFRTF